MFFLYETHVIEEKQYLFEVYFKNYTLNWIPAGKTHKSGRASGGCLYGVKKIFRNILGLSLKQFLTTLCNTPQNLTKSGFILFVVT